MPRIPCWVNAPQNDCPHSVCFDGARDRFPNDDNGAASNPSTLSKKRIIHTDEIDFLNFLQKSVTENDSILVVGGGKTAAQFVSLACDYSFAKVGWIHRRNVLISHFDTDLSWVGRRGDRMMAKFRRAGLEEKLLMLEGTRGGTVTPELWAECQTKMAARDVNFREMTEVLFLNSLNFNLTRHRLNLLICLRSP